MQMLYINYRKSVLLATCRLKLDKWHVDIQCQQTRKFCTTAALHGAILMTVLIVIHHRTEIFIVRIEYI